MTKAVALRINASEVVSAFLGGRNKNTLAAYRADLEAFAEFVEATTIPEAIGKLLGAGQGNANLLVLKYKNAMKEHGLQPTTANRRLSSIRAVVKMARMLGHVPWSIDVQNERVESEGNVKGVGTPGVNAILTDLRKRSRPIDMRNVAILRLFYDIGLRCSELIGIDLDDLHLDTSEVSILGKGRTRKERLTLPEPTMEAIKDWIAVRESTSHAVFINFDRAKKGSGRITRFGLYQVVRWLGERVNLKTGPHRLRHDAVGAAVRLSQENGIELPAVMRFSRHKRLSTLQIYVDSIFNNRQGEIAVLVASSLKPKKSKPDGSN